MDHELYLTTRLERIKKQWSSVIVQEAQEALGKSYFFVEELHGNELLDCSYSTEKMTPSEENLTFSKVPG